MNPEKEELPIEFESESIESLENFLRELEEQEKNLKISQNMIIEIDELDINDDSIPESFSADSADLLPNLSLNAHISNSPDRISSSNTSEIQTLKSKISELENVNGELVNTLAHQRKDFETFRHRTERERILTFRSQIGNLAMQLLPVLDNLNRALNMANNVIEGKISDSQQFFDGIVLVTQQLNETLAEMGVQPIKSVGEQFNPEFHEAVATEKSDKFDANTISEEFLRGYKIGDKVIRAAMVKVVVEN